MSKPLNCDYQGCKEYATYHIEDNGQPWETNSVACPDHVEDLKAKGRESVVRRIDKENINNITEKRTN